MELEEESEIKCGACQEQFSCKASLSQHKKLHTAEPGQLTKLCPVCRKDVRCERKDNYKRHLGTCEKKAAKVKPTFECIECDKEFNTKQHFEHHLDTNVHKGDQKKTTEKIRIEKKKKKVLEEWEDGYKANNDDYNEVPSMVDFSINETGNYASSTFDYAQYSFIGMEVVKQIIENIRYYNKYDTEILQ